MKTLGAFVVSLALMVPAGAGFANTTPAKSRSIDAPAGQVAGSYAAAKPKIAAKAKPTTKSSRKVAAAKAQPPKSSRGFDSRRLKTEQVVYGGHHDSRIRRAPRMQIRDGENVWLGLELQRTKDSRAATRGSLYSKSALGASATSLPSLGLETELDRKSAEENRK